jgi:glycosyltransferase involved in cell wall biosynthesis
MKNAGDTQLGAEYRLAQRPAEAQADLPLFLSVMIRNTGSLPWHNSGKHPVNLAYHWLDHDGEAVDFEGVRTVLSMPVAPGETAELEVHVEPPPQAGDYLLAIDLVEEGVGWFSLQGIAPLLIPLRVLPAPQNRPRVCIISSLCLPTDAVGNHIINQLRFFQARGYHALVLLEDVDRRHPLELRQHMAAISYNDVQQNHTTALTRRVLAHFRSAEIYIFHYAIHYGLFEAIAEVHRGVVVMDYHGVTPAGLWNIDAAAHERMISAQRQLELVRYADYAIAHSSYTRAELLARGGINPERVYAMGYEVPLDRFRPGPRTEALAARYGLAPGQPVLLYVGRIATNKRIDDLVRALALVRAQLPDAVLLLVGDNRSELYAVVAAQILSLAVELHLSDSVIFAGPVPDEELAAHFQLADLFVTASVHEGFCIPVIEAMASGVPVIGAHATALPETIGDGGYTFEPENPADLAAKALEILGAGGHGQSPTVFES